MSTPTPGTIDSEEPAKREKDETQKLKHVYIGVFFDGTSNNMVQQMMYNGYFNISLFGIGKKQISTDLKNELKDLKKLKTELLRDCVIQSEKHLELIDMVDEEIDELKNKISEAEAAAEYLEAEKKKIYDLQGKLHRKNIEYNSLRILNGKSSSTILNSQIKLLKEEINKIEEDIDKKSALLEVSERNLMDYSDESGFSNVSVLYSLFNRKRLEEEEENPAKAIKFYIEGSGATDMSCNTKANVNGLGFGLGNTGVTALVSKGIRMVTNYINSLKTVIDANTKVHFYVFGFSRGATCARLFTHIATRKRDGSEVLNVREKEFKDFIPNLVNEKGWVKFLEDTDLNWSNITVDILGIYDTVASIGFLRQKDGWSDFLRAPYAQMPNYIENWHYKNVTQYGLYLCPDTKKLKNVVHIGALDEFRENFAFTNIGATVAGNAVEILIPGCHSDVGGGYMDGDEQEISLPFFTTKFDKRVNTKIPLHQYDKEPAGSYLTAPGTEIGMDKLDSAPLRTKSLEYVGWIANWSVEKNKRKEDRATISIMEHNPHLTKYVGMSNWGFVNKIYFKRRVKRGWSDVALKIMIDKVNAMLEKDNSLKNDLFQSPSVYNYKHTISDQTVKNIANNMVSECGKTNPGNRYMMVPGGEISSELYKYLRLYYIHFTSSISIGHGVNPFRNWELNNPIEGSVGNFGNKPNFDLHGNLCRITYHGDKVDELAKNQPDNGYKTHVHYMYDLKFSQILAING